MAVQTSRCRDFVQIGIFQIEFDCSKVPLGCMLACSVKVRGVQEGLHIKASLMVPNATGDGEATFQDVCFAKDICTKEKILNTAPHQEVSRRRLDFR